MRFLSCFCPQSRRVAAALTLAALALSAPASAQDAFEPNDDCASPTLIGLGTTAGLTSGPDDDFFAVAIPANADITINALNFAGENLGVTLFDTGCGAPLASATGTPMNFFDCGGMAREVIVQVSGMGRVDEPYSLEIVGAEIVDDNLEDNDDCNNLSLVAISSFTMPNLMVTGCDEDYYVGRLQESTVEIQVDIVFSHAQGDIDIELYDLGCNTLLASSVSMDDNESLRYTNTSSPSVPEAVVVRIFMKNGEGFADYSLSACFGNTTFSTIGNQACSPFVNSTGRPATLCARGSDIVADNTVFFYVVDLPTNTVGYFVTSPTLDIVSMPGNSLGNLCVGAPGRYNMDILSTNSGSAVFFQPDMNAVPLSTGQVAPLTPGSTQLWQFWYRDTAIASSASNFSSALEISFN